LQNGEETNLQTNVEVTTDTEQPTENRTRYGRKVIRTQRWTESKEQDRALSHHRMVLSCTVRRH